MGTLTVKEKLAQAKARVDRLEKLDKLEAVLKSPIGSRIFSAILSGIAENRERLISTDAKVLIARCRKGFSDGGTLKKVYVLSDSGTYIEGYHYFKVPSGTEAEFNSIWERLTLEERLSLYEAAVELGKFMPVEEDGRATSRKPLGGNNE